MIPAVLGGERFRKTSCTMTWVHLLFHNCFSEKLTCGCVQKLTCDSFSDTPLIDHLVMREFVSGPPSYCFIYERVRDRKPSLRKGSWAVCGFRTEFFEKRQFFGSSFSFWVPSVSRDLTVCWLNITYTCFVYTVTDVDGDPPVKSPLIWFKIEISGFSNPVMWGLTWQG